MSVIVSSTVVAVVLLTGGWLRSRLVETRTPADDLGPDQQSRAITLGPRARRAGAIAATAGCLLADPILAIAIGAALAARPHLLSVVEQRRRRSLIEANVPDAIDLLILMIRAGLTPRQAVEASVTQSPPPIRPGFTEVERRLHRGDGLADALRGLPDTLGASLNSVADTLAIAERHGTPISDALTQLSIEVRQQRRRAAEANARKLPVRLSFPLVFCTLPSFVLVAIAPAVLAALSSLGGSTW